jgi:hypothetical protein
MFRKLLIRRSSKSISDKLLELTMFLAGALNHAPLTALQHVARKKQIVNTRLPPFPSLPLQVSSGGVASNTVTIAVQ